MLITYDSTADILYIELRRFPANDSIEVEKGVTIMLDKERRVVGIEVLQAREHIGMEQLRSVILRDLAWDTSSGIGPDYRPPVDLATQRPLAPPNGRMAKQEGRSPP